MLLILFLAFIFFVVAPIVLPPLSKAQHLPPQDGVTIKNGESVKFVPRTDDKEAFVDTVNRIIEENPVSTNATQPQPQAITITKEQKYVISILVCVCAYVAFDSVFIACFVAIFLFFLLKNNNNENVE